MNTIKVQTLTAFRIPQNDLHLEMRIRSEFLPDTILISPPPTYISCLTSFKAIFHVFDI